MLKIAVKISSMKGKKIMDKCKKMSFIVFLDVDGVLNTVKTCVHTPQGYTGIDDARVALLAKVIRKVGADGVVLTSTWKRMQEDEEDYVYLVKILDKYGIEILGKTKEERGSKREEGVLTYLETHPEIVDFVIVDDQQYGFRYYSKLHDSFIDTRGLGIENSIASSKTPSVAALLFIDAINAYK